MARSCCASMGSRPFPHGAGDQGNPASHVLVDLHAECPGADGVHDVVRDPGRQALAERSFIAIRTEIVLPPLRLEAAFTGLVLAGHAAEVGLAGARCLESRALKYYLWSYRDEGAFCESLAARIADDIVYAIRPRTLSVHVNQNVRGGIALVALAVREGT